MKFYQFHSYMGGFETAEKDSNGELGLLGAGAQGGTTSTSGSNLTPASCSDPNAPKGDAIQIICQADKYVGYGYLWGGGHGDIKQFVADFKAGKYAKGKDHILDCSGLVRAAIYEAFGNDIGSEHIGIITENHPDKQTYAVVHASSRHADISKDIRYDSDRKYSTDTAVYRYIGPKNVAP
jgi:hypothetical protein